MSSFFPVEAPEIVEELNEALHFPKDIATKDWIFDNIIFDSEASPLTGNFSTKTTPHLDKLFEFFDDIMVREIIMMWSSQTSKTTALLCMSTKALVTDPCKIQFMIPTRDQISDYLDDKYNPFIDSCKALIDIRHEVLDKKKKRIKGSSVIVPGGGLTITGSGRKDAKSKSVKYFFGDEIAEFAEGAVTKAEQRVKFYENHFSKVVLASTVEEVNDEITKKINKTQLLLEWRTPCVQCGKTFYATSKQLKFLTISEYLSESNIKDNEYQVSKHVAKAFKHGVHLECPHCKHKITTQERNRNILLGRYEWEIVRDDRVKGMRFSVGTMCSALSMTSNSLETVAKLVIEAGDDPVELDIVYKDYMNEQYDKGSKKELEESELLLLDNGIPEGIVPKDTATLVMGIDTQKDHFWYKVKAYTYDYIAHTVECGRVESFSDLEVVFAKRFKDQAGRGWMIERAGIDRRGIKERTVEVDAWVERLVTQDGVGEDFIYLTEGEEDSRGKNIMFSFRKHYEIETGKKRATNLKIMKIYNREVKDELAKTIKRSIALALDPTLPYAKALWYINSDIIADAKYLIAEEQKAETTDYIEQMTSEAYIFPIDKKTGKVSTKRVWTRIKKDNHLFDCDCTCLALAHRGKILMAERPTPSSGDVDVVGAMFG